MRTPATSIGPRPSPPHGCRRILICDADAELDQILAEHLSSCGHTVELCSSAGEVLSRLAADATSAVEVVITDLGMQDENGDELVQTLLDRHPDLNVILMTAHALLREQTLAGCSCPVLGKPCRLDEIEHLVGSCACRSLPTPNASQSRNTP